MGVSMGRGMGMCGAREGDVQRVCYRGGLATSGSWDMADCGFCCVSYLGLRTGPYYSVGKGKAWPNGHGRISDGARSWCGAS
jgi:hypothetical protein